MKKFIRYITFISSVIFTFLANPALALAQDNSRVNIKPEIAPNVSISGFISAVINLLFIVAAVIAIVFLIWGGIRWIISGGDKAAVESARNTIIAAIIGLVIVFLSFFILTIVFQFLGFGPFTDFKLPTVSAPNIDAR